HATTPGSTAQHERPALPPAASPPRRATGDPSADEGHGAHATTPGSTATPTPTPPRALAMVDRGDPSPGEREVGPGGPIPISPIRTRGTLAWPLKGVLYGRYGVRERRRHDGIDLAAPEGTPVLAAAAGTVIYAGEQPGYGAIVILRHEGGLVTLYAHNQRLLVKEGERVARGEPIARVGQSGKTSGPHLHFEVREGTRPKNPLLYLP
ncbi:MAG TPA: M23 family metallopeptidase, partial [Anaeromyxobacteraceae bacterium]|nr:M23 family metallopeptidase [Anaeromyxobacteraceae bacterium]